MRPASISDTRELHDLRKHVGTLRLELGQMRQRAEAAEAQVAALTEALRSIDNLDEASGHDLTYTHAFHAVEIARAALFSQALAGIEGKKGDEA